MFQKLFFSEIVLSIHLLFFIYILFTAISFLFSNTKKCSPKKKKKFFAFSNEVYILFQKSKMNLRKVTNSIF